MSTLWLKTVLVGHKFYRICLAIGSGPGYITRNHKRFVFGAGISYFTLLGTTDTITCFVSGNGKFYEAIVVRGSHYKWRGLCITDLRESVTIDPDVFNIVFQNLGRTRIIQRSSIR